MSATAVTQSSATSALLNISGLSLVLPQTDIRALESATDVEAGGAEPFSIGWIQYEQQRWPAYCLSHELSLLVDVPEARRACVLLGAGAGYIGILCDEVSIGKQEVPGQQHELPSAMRMLNTPVLGLIALDEDNIACVTNAQMLVAYIARLVKA